MAAFLAALHFASALCSSHSLYRLHCNGRRQRACARLRKWCMDNPDAKGSEAGRACIAFSPWPRAQHRVLGVWGAACSLGLIMHEGGWFAAPWWERGPGEHLGGCQGAAAGRREAARQWEGRGLKRGAVLAARPSARPARTAIAFVSEVACPGRRGTSPPDSPAPVSGAPPPPHPLAMNSRARPSSHRAIAGSTVQCRDATPEHCTEERFASTQCSTVVDPATGEPVRHCVKLYRRYLKCAGRCAFCFALPAGPLMLRVPTLWMPLLTTSRRSSALCTAKLPQLQPYRAQPPTCTPPGWKRAAAQTASFGLRFSHAGRRKWMRRSRRLRREGRARSSWSRTWWSCRRGLAGALLAAAMATARRQLAKHVVNAHTHLLSGMHCCSERCASCQAAAAALLPVRTAQGAACQLRCVAACPPATIWWRDHTHAMSD